MPAARQPTVVLCSPYVRARGDDATRRLRPLASKPMRLTSQRDERLREKEFGALDRLTKFGIRQKYPELAEQRAHVGKFYFRPPGGESWCDVILRLRSVLDTITREHRRERVLIVGHQVTVNCLRYLFERMTEDQILDDRSPRRRAELLGDVIRVRSGRGTQRQADARPGQLRRAADRSGYGGHLGAGRSRRAEIVTGVA